MCHLTRLSRRVSTRLLLGTTLFILIGGDTSLVGAPAHFWITDSTSAVAEPTAPIIRRAANATDVLYIWARPITGKELQNFSLNVIADDNPSAVIDFLDDEISVFNPQAVLDAERGQTLPRFQFTFDSSTDPPLTSEVVGGPDDAIEDIQAFSIDEASHAGVGPDCAAGEMYCAEFGDDDSWLLATIGYKTVASSGSVDIHLEIGGNGMNHYNHVTNETEPTVDTMVKFGVGPSTFDALNDRGSASNDAIAELTIQACSGINGDYNGNCVVDAADYTVWRDHYGQNHALLNESMTFGQVTTEDYNVWTNEFGTVAGSGSLSEISVPEPMAIPQLASLAALLLAGSRRALQRNP